MGYAYRMRVQRIQQESALEVIVSHVPIQSGVRFEPGTPGQPCFETPFVRDQLRPLLVDLLGSEHAADAVLREAESGSYSEREVPVGPDPDYMKLLDRLCGGQFLRKP
jgi:hypothetical protein